MHFIFEEILVKCLFVVFLLCGFWTVASANTCRLFANREN